MPQSIAFRRRQTRLKGTTALLRLSTALIGVTLLPLALPVEGSLLGVAAQAQALSGNGGDGGFGSDGGANSPGGSGGTVASPAGSDGGAVFLVGGGGGGGGAGGGVGGDGGGSVAGSGGTAGTPNGGAGTNSGGGGGGFGGLHGSNGPTLPNTGLVGGDGGSGGTGGSLGATSGGGGGGGAGGFGALVTGSGGAAGGAIAGGAGGAGGDGGVNASGGSGGAGGVGAFFTSTGAVFTTNGAVTGGTGGAAGVPGAGGGDGGNGGAGGAGIVGDALTIDLLTGASVTGGDGGVGSSGGVGGAGIIGSDLTIAADDGIQIIGGQGGAGRNGSFSPDGSAIDLTGGVNSAVFRGGATLGSSGFGGDLTLRRGTLAVQSGDIVTGGFFRIGTVATESAAVTVNGGTTDLSFSDLRLGQGGGTGTLTILDGARVEAGDLDVGDDEASTGTITVSGTGSRFVTSRADVGDGGTGTFNVLGGASASLVSLYLGDNEDSSGFMTVSGSAVDVSGSVFVGDGGAGNLLIESGGVLAGVGNATVGDDGDSTATAIVTGVGSTWSMENLEVGDNGDGTLVVSAGGSVVSNGDGTIADGVNSTSAATVTGASSSWTIENSLVVGDAGNGTLTVSEAGRVVVGDGTGDLVVGRFTGSNGTLNIGAAAGSGPVAAGILEAGIVRFGYDGRLVNDVSEAGTGIVTFNHTAPSSAPLVLPTVFSSAFSPVDPADRSGVPGSAGTIQQLAGFTSLTGDNSAFDSFIGEVEVTGGALLVNGVFGDLDATGGLNEAVVNVGSGGAPGSNGILGGSGTIGGSVNILAGGVLSPGNSVGTLTVLGGVAFEPASRYDVEIEAAGVADLLNVGGTAELGGAAVNVVTLDPGVSYRDGQRYLILDAAGGLGGTTFSGATLAGGSAFLTPSLEYTANTASLLIAVSQPPVTPQPPVSPPTPPLFQSVAETPNQFATAGALNTLGQTGESLALFNAILFSNAPNARAAFDQLSGELHASLKGALTETSGAARDAVSSRIESLFGVVAQGADLPVAEDRFLASGIWVDGFGTFGRADGNGNAARVDRDHGGVFLGADRAVSPNATLGLFGGYSHASIDARNGSADVDTAHVGGYGAAAFGAVEVSGGAAYAWNFVDTTRTVAFPGFTDRLEADYDAGTAQLFGEIGYRAELGGIGLKPFASVAYVHVDVDGFTERGGAARLTAGSSTDETVFTTLGLRATRELTLGGRLIEARGMAGWRHAEGDTDPARTFAFVTGSPFTVEGAPISKDAAVVEAGFATEIVPNVSLNLDYRGQFGDDGEDNGFRIGLSTRF